jgi:hypothetical protein
VRVGEYQIGFSGTGHSTVRIKRNGHTTYRTINSSGTFDTNVSKGKTTRIDLL